MPNPRPMSLIVKICGISSPAALDAAVEAGADMVGLMFFPPSPRFLDLDRARELAGRARGKVEIVAVTVDADDARLAEIVARVRPDWLQFHGSEPPRTRRRRPQEIQPAGHEGDRRSRGRRPRSGGGLSPDRRPPAGRRQAAERGGPARAAMASRSTGISSTASRRLCLICSRVASIPAMSRTRSVSRMSRGVDVSSGVETAPGLKDPDLIRAFIAAARRVEVRRPEGVPA